MRLKNFVNKKNSPKSDKIIELKESVIEIKSDQIIESSNGSQDLNTATLDLDKIQTESLCRFFCKS